MRQHFGLQLPLTWWSWSAPRQRLPTLRPCDYFHGRVLYKKCCNGMVQWNSYCVPLNLPITSIYFNHFFFFGTLSSLPNLCMKTLTTDVCLIQSLRQPLHALQLPTKGASWATADWIYGVYQRCKEGWDKKEVLSGTFTSVPLRISVSQLFPGLMSEATLGGSSSHFEVLCLTWNIRGNFTPSWSSVDTPDQIRSNLCQASSGSAPTASPAATCAFVTRWHLQWRFFGRSRTWWGGSQSPSLEMTCVATSRLLLWWQWEASIDQVHWKGSSQKGPCCRIGLAVWCLRQCPHRTCPQRRFEFWHVFLQRFKPVQIT